VSVEIEKGLRDDSGLRDEKGGKLAGGRVGTFERTGAAGAKHSQTRGGDLRRCKLTKYIYGLDRIEGMRLRKSSMASLYRGELLRGKREKTSKSCGSCGRKHRSF